MRSWNMAGFHRRPPCPGVAGQHDLEAFARDHLKRSLAAPVSMPSARTASVANGTKAAPVGVPTCDDYSLRPPASRWIKRAASIRFQLSGITCRVDFRPSAPTISCNRREPGINSASAQVCPTSPERARALRAHGIALLRATWHFINRQTARMFLRTHCQRVFPSSPAPSCLCLTGDYRGIERCRLPASGRAGRGRRGGNGRGNKPGPPARTANKVFNDPTTHSSAADTDRDRAQPQRCHFQPAGKSQRVPRSPLGRASRIACCRCR
jgi:hypothetical protein